MKITYGKGRKGRIVFDVEHKFAKGWCESDKCTMVMRAVIRKYPDAGNFKFYTNHSEGGAICGLFNEVEK